MRADTKCPRQQVQHRGSHRLPLVPGAQGTTLGLFRGGGAGLAWFESLAVWLRAQRSALSLALVQCPSLSITPCFITGGPACYNSSLQFCAFNCHLEHNETVLTGAEQRVEA